jgi:AcrR family transcriptional regulator
VGLRTDTKERMVASAAVLLSEQGVAGTSVAKVLEHSNGPRGSVGFHFPGGRAELLTDALTTVGDTVTEILRAGVESNTEPAKVFIGICRHYRKRLAATDCTAGCPIGAAMQEAHHDDDLGPVVAAIVADWHAGLSELLANAGHSRADARKLSMLAISSLEGAIMLARVTTSLAPIDGVIEHIAPLLSASR